MTKNRNQETKKPYQDDVEEKVKEGSQMIAKSGKDWVNYIEDHPIQSIFFVIIGYYAIKGLIK